jgi:hypothetical protein
MELPLKLPISFFVYCYYGSVTAMPSAHFWKIMEQVYSDSILIVLISLLSTAVLFYLPSVQNTPNYISNCSLHTLVIRWKLHPIAQCSTSVTSFLRATGTVLLINWLKFSTTRAVHRPLQNKRRNMNTDLKVSTLNSLGKSEISFWMQLSETVGQVTFNTSCKFQILMSRHEQNG